MHEGIAIEQAGRRIWVGIDWGEYHHAVAVVDDSRKVLARFALEDSLDEFRRMAGDLRALGDVAGVAIEATNHPIFGFLVSESFAVYPINPKLSKQWRACESVAGVKSDARDGRVLARELSRRHEELKVYKPSEAEVAELAGLCEARDTLVQVRTSHVLRLRSMMKVYYPALLDFFSDLTSPAAWRFIQKFPRPEALARARKATLIKFLKANEIGLKPIWHDRLEKRKEAADWPASPKSRGLEKIALAMTAQLLALAPSIKECEDEIAKLAGRFSDTSLMESLPGAGARIAPALTAMVAQLKEEAGFLEALRCLAGVAPVQNESGTRQRSAFRRRCNKHWRQTLHQFSNCSKHYCGWAKAYYDLRRERGDRHATALRKLADKWTKIICSMVEKDCKYDEAKYLEALRKSGSPVYERLCG